MSANGHRPRNEWEKCSGCGRPVEWGGNLTDTLCAACREPDIAALCRAIDKRDARWTEDEGVAAMRRYQAWARGAAALSPDAVSAMLARPSADSGKRGGGPNNGGSE